MRLRLLIPVLLIACLAAGGAVTVHASGDRQRTFSAAAADLRAEWATDERDGVPAASLSPLRAELAAHEPSASWWSWSWLGDDGHALLDRLRAGTRSAWNAALAGQREQAAALIGEWSTFASQQTAWVAATSAPSAAAWEAQLGAATTPAAVARLVTAWRSAIAAQRTAVASAQQAALARELRSAGGPRAVLATARRLVAIAASANLDAGNLAPLAAQLSDEITRGAGSEAIATGESLLTAIGAVQTLVNLNDQVSGQLLPLLYSVDQAAAERTPHGAALAAQDSALRSQFRDARTHDQLSAVEAAVRSLQGQVAAELSANQCGHPVGSGKVITISLSLQEMVFYQDGCAVRATPVSTGRPQLRTPTGRFSIFYKKTPFTFVSPWPPSSPFYYFPSPVSWVMEFASGGYFIHDAPWEAPGEYGPGSEDNLSAASHGCVHTPTSVMAWAFTWTPLGTPVLISA